MARHVRRAVPRLRMKNLASASLSAMAARLRGSGARSHQCLAVFRRSHQFSILPLRDAPNSRHFAPCSSVLSSSIERRETSQARPHPLSLRHPQHFQFIRKGEVLRITTSITSSLSAAQQYIFPPSFLQASASGCTQRDCSPI